MYWNAFKDSWKRLWKNPGLLLPDFIFVLFFSLGGYLLLRSHGLLSIIQGNNIETLLGVLSNFNKLFGLLVSVTIFTIATFFLGASLLSWKYIMIRNRILNKRTSLWSDFKDCHKRIRSVIFMKIIVFAIAIVALFLGVFLVGVGRYFGNYLPGLIIVSLLEVVFFVLFFVFIYFRYAILFFKEYRTIDAFKESINLGKRRYEVVVISFLISLIFGLSVTFIFNSVFSLFKIAVFSKIISVLIGLIIGVWADLFLFDVYHRIRKKD